jgi:regulatory protein
MGLKEIDENDYRKTLEKLANQKWEQLTEEQNMFNKKRKLTDYLLQKGYEYNYISEIVLSVSKNQ